MRTASQSTEEANAARIEKAIRRAQQYLLAQQSLDGYWWAELEANPTMTAEFVMLHRVLNSTGVVDARRERQIRQARRYLLREQRAHGGWELFYGDGGELSTTIEVWFALRLAGEPVDSEALQRARKFILARGGLTRARVFTKLHLALFGAYPWEGIPTLPAWLMLLPGWFPFNIYEMASWARSSTVPLLIVCDRKPVYDLGVPADELFVEGSAERADIGLKNNDGGWTGSAFLALDRIFKWMDRAGCVPFRRRALERAERWIIERQNADGDWAGIIPAMLNSLLAVHVLGYSVHHPVVKRGLEALDRFGIEQGSVEGVEEAAYFRLQPCISPTWDTALALAALLDSGLPKDHPRLQEAGEWLLSRQIFRYGDWSVKNRRGKPGGWAFEFANDQYPDVDDTAAVVLALLGLKLNDEEAKREACRAAARWVLSMQCRAGGWAAFDLDNTRELLNRMPYGDLKAMIDPPTADVSGRVLEMLGSFESTLGEIFADKTGRDRAVGFLLKLQEPDGSWLGRWGVNYIYGTHLALVGLKAAGFEMGREEVRRAAQWLRRVQNEDGGWGESCATYVEPGRRGRGVASTPSQTAWALMGLMATGDFESEAVSRGIGFLLDRQNEDGSWPEQEFTGTGFPGHFYLNYHQYRNQFPLTALGRFFSVRQQRERGSRGNDENRETHGTGS